MALAATAVGGYLTFSSWFLSWHLVKVVGLSIQILALGCLVFKGRLTSEQRDRLRPLLAPAGLVFCSGLIVLSLGFAYGGMDSPPPVAEARFSHQLPGDSDLPYILSHEMMKYHRIPRPIQVDWLASDRPPLQSAMILSQYFSQIGPAWVAYQVFGTYLQSLWVFGLWLLLYSLRIDVRAIGLILACCLCTNFVFVNSIFVWPKLLAAAYLLGFFALMFDGDLAEPKGRLPLAITAGVLLCWSLLSHGGTVFACLGFAPIVLFLLLRKRIALRPAATALAVAIVLYIPWILFQKYVDPPGNRLVKMHLAGVAPVDNRPVGHTIIESYRSLPFSSVVTNKEKNFATTFRNDLFWPTLHRFLFEIPKAEPERSRLRLQAAKDLNAFQFFYLSATLGFYLPGLALLLVPKLGSTEWRAAWILTLLTLSTNVIWCLIMFGPGATVIHSGAYATVLSVLSAAVLGFWIWSRWLAYAVAAAQISLFVWIHFFVLVPQQGTLHVPMAWLCGIAVAGAVCLFLSIGSFWPRPLFLNKRRARNPVASAA